MQEIEKKLAKSALFMGMEEERLKAFVSMGIRRDYLRGELLFQEGEEAKGLFIILSGRVKIFKSTYDGKEKILHILGEGEPVGEVPMFAAIPYPASAESMEPCQLFFISAKNFINKLTINPELALSMLAILSRRLRVFTTQIEHLSLKEAPARLAAYLCTLSKEMGGKKSLSLPLSKTQLASLLGTSPETLSRILGRMTAAGYLDVMGNTISISDLEGLALLADEGKME